MYSNKLSPAINISSLSNSSNIIDYLYQVFKNGFLLPTKRPNLYGKFIFVNCNNWINNKAETFWHLISLSIDESFNILPCNNDTVLPSCDNNCIKSATQVMLNNGQARNICFYRGVRIEWINDIIKLANNNDPNIKVWRKKVTSGGRPAIQLYLRFQHETADYVLIFEEKYKEGNVSQYFFITAFPVFYINTKSGYDRDYIQYTKYGV